MFGKHMLGIYSPATAAKWLSGLEKYHADSLFYMQISGRTTPSLEVLQAVGLLEKGEKCIHQTTAT